MFRKIIKALIKFTNDEAVLRSSQHGQPLESRHPAPPERDLRAAFRIADGADDDCCVWMIVVSVKIT
jgi:hypothetical protein